MTPIFRTFVKVQVYDDRTAHTFERKIVNDAFGYMHNEKEVEFDYYLEKLTELHLRTYMSTLFVNLNIMNVFVSFTDIERSEMIEGICGSSLEKPKYDRIYNRLHMNKEELNNAMQRQKYLTSQRNELKKRKRLTDNLNITKRRHEEKRLEFYYFKLFHNQNIITVLEPQVVENQNKYDALLKESFTMRKLVTQDERRRTALYNELKGYHKTLQEHGVQNKKSYLDSYLVKEEIEKLKNDITDLNYVVGQNNVEHIVDTIKMLGDRLEIMELDKEKWNTIYNSVNVLKYFNLQIEFEDQFPEMVVTSRSSAEEMKLNSRDINRYNLVLLKQKRLMENLQNSINKLNSDMVKLEEESKTTEKNRVEIQNQRKSIEVLTRKIENEMHSRIDNMYKNTFGLNPKQLKNIVKLLKSNNPGVFGRISDFSRTPNATLQEALKCRFGFRYETIIVDTKETAHDCISLLKSLNFNEHNETFLFLSGLKLKDTEEFMVDKEGVRDIKFEYIENVLSTNMDSIKDALISCASKTVICKTYDDAVKVFDLEKNNVNVVSTDDQLLFERSGFITKDSKVCRSEISDKELNDLKLKRLEAEEKVRELALVTSKTSKIKLMSEISIIKRKLINIIEETNNEHKEAEKIKKIINSLTLKNNSLKQKSSYEGNPTEDEFFAEFCKQFSFPNIGEYRERMLHPIAPTTMKGINDRVEACKIELSKSKNG